MKEFQIFIGNYGSGKTELSLNFALQAAKQGKKALLIDLDIVNPYFRSGEKVSFLNKNGVEVIVPPYACSNVDLPVVPANVATAFIGDYDAVIFDVGGDAVGATALGQYHAQFEETDGIVNTYYVVNMRRPLSSTKERICALLQEIETASRQKITGLINNTNLAKQTTPDDLIAGHVMLKEVSEALHLPIQFTTGEKEMIASFKETVKDASSVHPVVITTYMRPDWLDAT